VLRSPAQFEASMPQDAGVPATSADYALLDIGDGRRLERFGSVVVDRPAPGAEGHVPQDLAAWVAADARYDRADRGAVAHEGWTTKDGEPIEPWQVHDGSGQFELRLATSGQVGFFPEQRDVRTWIGRQARRLSGGSPDPGVFAGARACLNLFGYSGAVTIEAALAGLAVTHVDASRPAVAWARRNAELNGLAAAPIRWISDDAIGYAERELRRGRRYAGIVLDPPSYGHGSSGKPWRLAADLPSLLETCTGLLDDGPAFIVVTAHTPGFGPDRLGKLLLDALEPELGSGAGTSIEVEDQSILSEGGTRLHLGSMARWSR
jgi:23S rRNA (cytosine1962-C5)-methyltransferase